MNFSSKTEKNEIVFQYAPGYPKMVKPEDLQFFDQLLGEGANARHEDLRVFWCNDAYVGLGQDLTRDDIIGTRITDFQPPIAAAEREAIYEEVIRTGQPSVHINFCADKKLLQIVLPLDEEAFGRKGVLVLIKDAPIGSRLELTDSIPLITTPCFNELDTLSARELEVFYYISTGLSNAEIADNLFRAVKTVENHVASIHRKLQTTNRSKLVRLGVERGIHTFTPEQWKTLIDGAQRIRKDTN